MLRSACVAGQFYPAGAVELEGVVRGFLTGGPAQKAVAAVAPHAGYVYSGAVAGAVFSSIEIPDAILLIGPNHTGVGQKVSIMTTGAWEMPFGRMEINERLGAMLLTGVFKEDSSAHLREHSLEVELPFIHYLNPDASFVPITVMQAGYEECVEAGAAIAKAVSAYGKEVLIVVSSDMNHYESDSMTRKKDNRAIEKVLSLDAKGLLETTSEEGITMCGVIPAVIAIEAAKRLKAKTAKLVKYATSGDTSGDTDHVVGYAGIVIR